MTDRDPDRVGGWWVLWAILVPFGFGTPAGFLYAAHRARARRWYVWAAVWAALVATGVVMTEVGPEDGALDTGGSLSLFAVWIAGAAHALAVRPDYVRRVSSGGGDPLTDAQARLKQRERAQQLARDKPDLARELGVGRPDLPDAEDMAVVDVNHAPVQAVAQVPGIGFELAERLVAARQEVGGFASAEDAGVVLDLDPTTVDRISRRAVFLPF
jgi:hypothetical protein